MYKTEGLPPDQERQPESAEGFDDNYTCVGLDLQAVSRACSVNYVKGYFDLVASVAGRAKPSELLVLLTINHQRNHQWSLSQDDLARTVGLKLRTVGDCLRKLAKLGLIRALDRLVKRHVCYEVVSPVRSGAYFEIEYCLLAVPAFDSLDKLLISVVLNDTHKHVVLKTAIRELMGLFGVGRRTVKDHLVRLLAGWDDRPAVLRLQGGRLVGAGCQDMFLDSYWQLTDRDAIRQAATGEVFKRCHTCSVPTADVCESCAGEPMPGCFGNADLYADSEPQCHGGFDDIGNEYDPCPYANACGKRVARVTDLVPFGKRN